MSSTIDKIQNIHNQVHRLIEIYRNVEKSLGEKNNRIQELSENLELERKKKFRFSKSNRRASFNHSI